MAKAEQITPKSLLTALAIAVFCVVFALAAILGAQRQSASSIGEKYDIPSFSELKTTGDTAAIDELQVVRKAKRVGLATRTIPDLTQTEKALVADLDKHFANKRTWHRDVVFKGETAQELQQVLDDNPDALVRIEKGSIDIDQTIYLRDDRHLDANGARLEASCEGPAFRIEGSNVSIDHALISGTASIGILVHNSSFVRIQDSAFRHLDGKAIVVSGNTTYFRIAESTFTQCKRGAIMASGDASYGLIEANSISDNEGYSNWMAGIVLTNLQPDDPEQIWQAFPDDPPHFAARDTLADVPVSAHNIVVRGNVVSGNQSSGIYCDGVYGCYLYDNQVIGNDKEGMCLDYGALSCRVHDNEFAGNGRRIRQSDEALELDGMLSYGKLDDGSAAAKLPAISLDNAAYNIVENNKIHDNWGGGVKAVCTAVRNLVASNTIADNNLGENDVFYFTGVELGNVDGPDALDMDHVGCFQNIVVDNTITGNHYTGVFIGHDSSGNKISGNTIQGQKRYAMMSGSKLANDISGNDYDGFVIDRSIIPF